MRQRLTEIRLPDDAYRLAPPRWAEVLAYAAAVATAAICFRASSLPALYRITGTLLTSVFLLAIAFVLRRRERHRRRLQTVATVRKALEQEGARLAAILEEM